LAPLSAAAATDEKRRAAIRAALRRIMVTSRGYRVSAWLAEAGKISHGLHGWTRIDRS
jgi:hypothetical protein